MLSGKIDPGCIHDLHGLDYVAGWEPYDLHELAHDVIIPRLDPYYTDPSQKTTTTGAVDDL